MSYGAPGNAEQFKISFREEAREILTELESALLELHENRGDKEVVGRIFRGMHTIKGSGAMFGFERLAAFTHDLETAYDLVRNGRLEVTSELVDLTLGALDQIAAMLNEGTEGAVPADPAACAGILANVRRLASIEEETKPVKKNEAAPVQEAVSAGPTQNWHIRFAPGPDLMRYGAKPSLLLNELGQLGKLTVKAILDTVPPLGEIDPERCYIRWEMDLATGAGQEAIRDVSSLSKIPLNSQSSPAPNRRRPSQNPNPPAPARLRSRRGLWKKNAPARRAGAATTSRRPPPACASRR